MRIHRADRPRRAQPIYPRAFAARRIAAEVPGADDRKTINEIIFDELVNGMFTVRSRRE